MTTSPARTRGAFIMVVAIAQAKKMGALGTADAFHAAYWVIFAFAVMGALTAAIAFPWHATRKTGAAPRRGVGSVPANG